MIRFSNLLDSLLLTPSKKKKIEIIVNYFKSSSINEKGWAFSILTRKFTTKYIKYSDLKKMIKNKTSDELFSYSYDYVGDFAETFSLLWPQKKTKKESISLSYLMDKILNLNDKKLLIEFLESIFNKVSSNEIYAIIKILTGGLRIGVSDGILKESFTKLGKRNKFEIKFTSFCVSICP